MTTVNNIYAANNAPAQVTQLTPSTPSSGSGLSFGDVLDTLNPLQHIPVVSSLYRAVTGSQISTAAKLAGDTLYGGVVGGAVAGFASSLADVAVKQVTGADISQHVVGAISSATSSSAAATKVTMLIPDNSLAITPQAKSSNADINDQVNAAANTILHPTKNPQGTNGEYARAQALGALNKSLVQMAV